MANLEGNPCKPIGAPEPFLRSNKDEVCCTTPSFIANLLRNDGMTPVSGVSENVSACRVCDESGDVVEGARPLMPPTIEELEAIESEGNKGQKKDDEEPHDKLMSSLIRAESPPAEKRSLQPPTLAELDALKEDDKADPQASKIPEKGLHMRDLRKFLLPEALASLELDTKDDDYWQAWNDTFKIFLATIADKNGNFFAYQFLRKIFNPLRKCGNCRKYNTSVLVTENNPLELFITDRGILGRIKVHCINCGETEPLVSCEDPEEIPTDVKSLITLEKTKGNFVKRFTHHEVLHDLMELLHIAAIEHCAENKKRHLELAEFLLVNARKVCEQWCRLEYRELRVKKFIRFREEVLLVAHNPSYMPACTREYMEMYEMMANSFRQNRDHIHTILQAIKDSLIDSPSRSQCMFWIAIALLHAENYYKFKQKYDPRSCMRIDEGEYWALHDRYIGLDAPVGVKKIPVVFVLFELPRFYHYIEFLEKNCGRRAKIYLTKEERYELGRAEKEAIKRGFSRPKKTGVIISPEKHLDFLMRQEELVKMTRNKEFVSAFNKKQQDSKKRKREKRRAIKGIDTSKTTSKTIDKKISSVKEPHSISQQNTAQVKEEADALKDVFKDEEKVTEKPANKSNGTKIEEELEVNPANLHDKKNDEADLSGDIDSDGRPADIFGSNKPAAEGIDSCTLKYSQNDPDTASMQSSSSIVEVPSGFTSPPVEALDSPLDPALELQSKPLNLKPHLDTLDRLSSHESKQTLDPLDRILVPDPKPNLDPLDHSLSLYPKPMLGPFDPPLLSDPKPKLDSPNIPLSPGAKPKLDLLERSLSPGPRPMLVPSDPPFLSDPKPKLDLLDRSLSPDVRVKPKLDLFDRSLSPGPNPKVKPLDCVSSSKPELKLDPLDRPLSPDLKSKSKSLGPWLSPGPTLSPDPKLELDDTEEFLDLQSYLNSQPKMDQAEVDALIESNSYIKRSLEMYAKMNPARKSSPLGDFPKESPAVHPPSYDASQSSLNLSSDTRESKEWPCAMILSTNDIHVKTPKDALVVDPIEKKKLLEEAIRAKVVEEHGPIDDQAILVVEEGKSPVSIQEWVDNKYLDTEAVDEIGRQLLEKFSGKSTDEPSATNSKESRSKLLYFNELLRECLLEEEAKAKVKRSTPTESTEQECKENDEMVKSLLFTQAHSTIQTLLECGDASRLGLYLDCVYQKEVMDSFLCHIDEKVCNRALDMDPDEIRETARLSVVDYRNVIASELKKHSEKKKKRKARIIAPEVDPAFKGKMNPGSYSFRGLAVGGENQPSNLPRNAMMCTQVSTDLLRSQGYKVDTDCKMVSVIADNDGVIQKIVEGLDTAEDMQHFIERQLKVPKKNITDGAGYMVLPSSNKPGGIVGWKNAKEEPVKFTGNPKKAKKKAKKLAKEPKAKKNEGERITLGKRSFTHDEIREMSTGDHPLMEGLPDIDLDVDPFDVEALKAMHPWLKIVENAVMEPKNEEERQAVYDKMMTPVPVKGLDPDTPRHIIALPQGRENAEDYSKNGVDPVEEYKANFKLSSQLKSEISAHSNKDTSISEEKLSGGIPQKMSSRLPDSPTVSTSEKKVSGGIPQKMSSRLPDSPTVSTSEEKLSGGIPQKMSSRLPDSPTVSTSEEKLSGGIPQKMSSRLPDSPTVSTSEKKLLGGIPQKMSSRLPDSPTVSTSEEKLSGGIPQKMSSRLPDSPTVSTSEEKLSGGIPQKMSSRLPDSPTVSTSEKKLLGGIPQKMSSRLPDSPTVSTSEEKLSGGIPQKMSSRLPDSPTVSPRKKFSKVPDSPAVSPRKKFSKFPDSQADTSPLLSMLEPHLYSPEKKVSDDDEQRRKLLTKEQERDVLESTEIIDLLKAKADKKKNKNKTINYEESSIPHRQMRILDAMEVPYRLDNIMVMTEPVMDGGLISKITLLPFENSNDVPQPKSSSQVSQVIQKYSSRNPSENTFQDSRLAKNLRRKVKKRQAALKSTLLTKTDSQSVDSIDDTKSSSSAASLGGSSDKSDELVVRKQESQVSTSSRLMDKTREDLFASQGESSLMKRQDSQRSTASSSGVDDIDESLEGENSANGKARMTARDRFKTCANCNTLIKDRIQLCSGCKKVAYCNSMCQKANWKTHKKTCTYAAKKRTG